MFHGPTHPRNHQKSYAVTIFHEKTPIHCITRQNRKSWIFLQDFSREKWILDKNKCPFPIGQPLSLFQVFIEVWEPCLKNKRFRTSLWIDPTNYYGAVFYNTPLYATLGRSATNRVRRIIRSVNKRIHAHVGYQRCPPPFPTPILHILHTSSELC